MPLKWGIFARKKTKKTLFCTFCGKDSASVKALIAGPAVFICDGCVALCNQCLGGGPMPPQHTDWDKFSDEHLLTLLARSAEIADSASEFLHRHVETLRKRGVQWAVIGKALGISRQAAWERFS
jgi:hypothetical protein